MSFNIGAYNRYVTFQSPTNVNTKSKRSRTWTTVFTGYAKKKGMGGDTDEESGKPTGVQKSKWLFPYNPAITGDGRFFEGNATSNYYYVTNIAETRYQSEMEITAELR